MSLPARLFLVVVAAAAIVALAIGLHVIRLQQEALALAGPQGQRLDLPGVERMRALLVAAEHPNAGVEPLLLQGQLLTFAGNPRGALAALERAVRREPENYQAWRQLARAAETVDPRRAAQARARLDVLSPPVPGVE